MRTRMILLAAMLAVIVPVFETVAIELLFDAHVTVRPVITLPDPSRSTAVAWIVAPI